MSGIKRQKYKTDAGNIFYVLIDDSTGVDSVAGTQDSGGATEEMTIRSTKNRKEVGIRPRTALLTREIGSGEDQNCLIQTGERYKRLVILTKDHADSLTLDQNYTIGGTQYKLAKVLPEEVA